MYYPDLSIYEYGSTGEPSHNRVVLLNIGWLDGFHEYPQGDVPEHFQERLLEFCSYPVRQMMGYHVCELCQNPSPVDIAYQGKDPYRLGSAEIRVMGKHNIWYAAPNLIYHYVVEHRYLPPKEFIQSVLTSSLPYSKHYQARIQQALPAWYTQQPVPQEPRLHRLNSWFKKWRKGNS